MGRKKQEMKLAYVGRYRRARRACSAGKSRQGGDPVVPTVPGAQDPAPRDGQEIERGAGEGPGHVSSQPATSRRPQRARPLWLDPLVALPRALYRTIPLHGGERTEEVQLRSARSGSMRGSTIPLTPRPELDSETGSGEGGWFPLPVAPVPLGAAPQDPPRPTGAQVDEPLPALPTKARTSDAGPIERLDRVVHDFVASLNREMPIGLDDGAVSAHADRFRRFLEHVPSMQGQVIGPPVILGASPPIGLECTLGLLGSLRKTGILRVQADDVSFMVSIVRGDVVHGVSDPRPESELLGNVLLSRGILDPGRLARFFEEYGSSTSRIAEALNRQALVSTDELRQALEHQLQLLFDRLLSTRESVWCFHEGEATLAYINMRMNVISVLLESARKNDEGQVA